MAVLETAKIKSNTYKNNLDRKFPSDFLNTHIHGHASFFSSSSEYNRESEL